MLNQKQSIRKARKKRRIRRAGIAVVVCLLLTAGIFTAAKWKPENNIGRRPEPNQVIPQSKSEKKPEPKKPEPKKPEPKQLTGIYSKHAVLADLNTGETLASLGADEKTYPASLTKIMTAFLAVEEIPDLTEKIVVPEHIFSALYAENASRAGFDPGEEVSARDLLYGILLPSGAECCLAVAEHIDGSEEAFVDRMNRKAQELGMKNTHFDNSTGLHTSTHYTTAGDLALLLIKALQNKEFREVFTSSRYSTNPTDKHPQGFTFGSTMFKAMGTREVNGGEILGGKTGYTQEAGLCLASLAVINGREYILVTTGAQGNHKTQQFHILDAKKVYGEISG